MEKLSRWLLVIVFLFGFIAIGISQNRDTCFNIGLWNKVSESIHDVIEYNDILANKVIVLERYNTNLKRDISLKEGILGTYKERALTSEHRVEEVTKVANRALNDLKKEKRNRVYYIAGGAISMLALTILL